MRAANQHLVPGPG